MSGFGAMDKTPFSEVALADPAACADAPRALECITTDARVMSAIANGKTWDAKKRAGFLRYCATEAKQSNAERANFWYAVVADGKCRGFAGVHPCTYDRGLGSGPVLTIFLEPRACGRRLGGRAIRLVLERYWKARGKRVPVVVDTRADNRAMAKCMARLLPGVAKRQVRIHGRPYVRWVVAGFGGGGGAKKQQAPPVSGPGPAAR
jgi:RimJ/RimL family protein N-acetyltransferase